MQLGTELMGFNLGTSGLRTGIEVTQSNERLKKKDYYPISWISALSLAPDVQ
jgi:hypothetical protein